MPWHKSQGGFILHRTAGDLRIEESYYSRNLEKHHDVDQGIRLISHDGKFRVLYIYAMNDVPSPQWFDTPEAAKLAWELSRETEAIDRIPVLGFVMLNP